MTVYYNDFGGYIAEDKGNFYTIDDNANIDKQITKEDMDKYLKAYRHCNVINRPAICFTIEKTLGKKTPRTKMVKCVQVEGIK